MVPCGGAGYALVWASPDRGQTWHLVTMDKADQAAGDRVVAFAPRQAGTTDRCTPTSLMGDAVAFGSQVVVVGASPNFGAGIVWIGEWANG